MLVKQIFWWSLLQKNISYLISKVFNPNRPRSNSTPFLTLSFILVLFLYRSCNRKMCMDKGCTNNMSKFELHCFIRLGIGVIKSFWRKIVDYLLSRRKTFLVTLCLVKMFTICTSWEDEKLFLVFSCSANCKHIYQTQWDQDCFFTG